jgi:hypothetical protein
VANNGKRTDELQPQIAADPADAPRLRCIRAKRGGSCKGGELEWHTIGKRAKSARLRKIVK